MLVSSPWGARASVPAVRLLALLLVAMLAFAVLHPGASQAAPKLLKKATVSAPKGGTVKGTLTGSKCRVKYPKSATGIKVTVQGPLSVKKPKTTKLKTKGKKTVTCTWKTASFADGNYRLTATSKIRVGKKRYKVTLKRTVTVRNTVAAAGSGSLLGGAAAAPNALIPEGPPLGAGTARFVARLSSDWDSWLHRGGAERRDFVRRHFWGVSSFTPFYDQFLSWSPPTLFYKDLYAIYREDAATVNAHPDWILRDAGGNPLYIDWGCQPGPCPQYAGDFGSPAFRAKWIAEAREAVAKGYSGIWIDDVNMEFRIGDATGKATLPIDPRTRQPMTYLNWRRYMAEFLEEIRRALPGTQLVANVLWFGGTSIGRDSDPLIQRAYRAVDRLNLERGFNDDGLTAGYAPRDVWSVETFMQFIDRMHDMGLPVTLDSAGQGIPAWEYNLAGVFLVDRGLDAVGEMALKAGEWWNGWDVRLGDPLGARERRTDGVFERRFQRGWVLLNPSKGATKTIKLGKTYKRIDGSSVSSVTLGGGRAAILIGS